MVPRRVSSACISLCTIIALASMAFAVPANRQIWTFTQPDGTRFQATLHGDEFYLYHQTLNGEIIVEDRDTGEWFYAQPRADGSLQKTATRVGQNRIKIAASDEKPQWLNAIQKLAAQKASQRQANRRLTMTSTQGDLKGVLLLANFSDTSTTYTRSTFRDLMNATGYQSHGALGSVKDYYLEASYGKLTLQSDVFGWFSVSQSRAYYGRDDPDPQGEKDLHVRDMIEEVIAKADATVNFADYDRDGDGWVDLFGVLHQGQDQQQNGVDSDAIRSHQGQLQEPILVDGVRIQEYYTVPEKCYEDLATIGVFCHEIAHSLGVPDLYDTDDSNGSSYGVGNWSVMGVGGWLGPNGRGAKPCHFDPRCKYMLGWLTPQVIDAPRANVILPAFDEDPTALLIPIDPYQDAEYLLVVNRYARETSSVATGFDQYLPGSGALILHIDEDVPDNNTEACKQVDVEEADGQHQLDDHTNAGDSGDLYPNGSSAFTDTSTPDTRDNKGASTGIAVCNFRGASTERMTCDVAPPGSLKGYTISYDTAGRRTTFGYGDSGAGHVCVRFQVDQGGVLDRVKVYFTYGGTTDYTINVYSGWLGDRPWGFLTVQAGSHTGRGYEEIALAVPQTFKPGRNVAAGVEFVVEIQYDTKGGDKYPLPVVDDGDCSERTYVRSSSAYGYRQLTPSNDMPYDALIRAGLRPLPSADPEPGSYTLAWVMSPSGAGTVVPSPNKAAYAPGEQVVLAVLPGAGYVFAGWSGSLSGSSNPTTIVMDSNRSIMAVLEPQWTCGLVAHWKLDETSGKTAYDSAGGHHGTLFGTSGQSEPGWQPLSGRAAGALGFDGIDDYVDCGNPFRLNITDAITLAAWVKVDSGSYDAFRPFVGKGDHGYMLRHWRDSINFFISDGTWYMVSASVGTSFRNSWHHVAGTYDGQVLRVYVDGQLRNTVSHAGKIASTSYNVNIGRNSEVRTRLHDGLLDDVRIYDRALTDAEIRAVWSQSPTGN